MKKYLFLVIFIFILLGIVSSFQLLKTPSPSIAEINDNPTVSATKVITYAGKEGVDALTLLRSHYPVKQDSSGLVISIDNRDADFQKNVYWTFYINGEMASVGLAEYQTKSTDSIEWRLESF